MPDSKITALTSISTSTDPANDPLVIVDVSDTSMAATGTTKKVTLNQLLGASGTATLASATITGDLTVDTNTLKVDSSNNRVGIGTASPSVALDVVGAARFVAAAAGPKLSIENAGGSTRFKSTDTSSFYYSAYDHNFTNTDGSINRYTIDNNGVSTWYVSGTTAMTLNATGLGVGVASPATKLDVRGANNANQATFSGTAGRGLLISTRSDSLSDDRTVILNAQYATGSLGQLVIQTAGTDRLLVDANGNCGIGVTPSAWSTSGNYMALQVGGIGLYGRNSAGNELTISSNGYYSSTGWKYITTSYATRYEQQAGVHAWHTAPSGTAGNAITFTQAMTLDASGNLLVGTTSNGITNTNSHNLSKSGYIGVSHASTPTGDYYLAFGYNGSIIGSITQNGTTGVLYNITSDYRLKEQVQPLVGGLARVNALKPSVYKWKSDGSNGEGFLAHELAEVVPFAVSGEKDAVNEDGSIKSQGIDMSRVVPILVAAIQELAAEVNALKNA